MDENNNDKYKLSPTETIKWIFDQGERCHDRALQTKLSLRNAIMTINGVMIGLLTAILSFGDISMNCMFWVALSLNIVNMILILFNYRNTKTMFDSIYWLYRKLERNPGEYNNVNNGEIQQKLQSTKDITDTIDVFTWIILGLGIASTIIFVTTAIKT